MEKAILKTLIYADIFDYPLKAYEIHKWLIGRKANLRQVESALSLLVKSARQRRGPPKAAKCKVLASRSGQSGYYFLHKKGGLVGKRKRRKRQSVEYLKKAKILASILKVVQWVKLAGVSGGLAMENASYGDDIDLFIITSKNRLWITRLLTLGLLSLVGQRRKVGDVGRKIAGKFCINILLEEDNLEQKNKDIYLAHEVLQMRVLWERDGVYQKYLEENEWAFRFLPNWTTNITQNSKLKAQNYNSNLKTLGIFENLAKWFQLKIMRGPKGMERIEDGALYFHPNDCRPWVLSEYRQRIKKLSTP